MLQRYRGERSGSARYPDDVRLRRAVIASAIAAAAIATALSGCSPIVALDPAAHANDPACADVIVRLPDTLENLPKRETDAQSTGAWGDPAQILLRCGVAVPTVSDLPCVQIDNDVYWLRDDAKAPNYVFTTYGRTPAIAVVVDQTKVTPGLVLSDLDAVISFTKPNGRVCSSVEDSLGSTPTPSPTPSPTPTLSPTASPSPSP
jgi:hypothetical protein